MTKEQLNAGMAVLTAMSETIRELGQVPSGHLYAQVMSKIDLTMFESIIRVLVNAKLVERDEAHMLRWIGPAKGGQK